MNRFSSISNVNSKYINSQVPHNVQGYPSSYTPPSTAIKGSILRSSHVATATLPTLHPGAQVIRVEEAPQIIYHQPPPGQVTTTQRKVISAGDPIVNTPPFRGSIGEEVKSSGCPWWCCLLFGIVGLLILAGVGYGLWTYLAKNGSLARSAEAHAPPTLQQRGQSLLTTTSNSHPHVQQQPAENAQNISRAALAAKNQPSSEIKVTKLVCEEGFFLNNGMCISCPKDTVWNGTNCIRRKAVTQMVSSESDNTVSGTEDNESESNKNEGTKGQNDSESGSKSHFNAQQGSNQVTSNATDKLKSGLKSIATTTGSMFSDAWEAAKILTSGAWQGVKSIGKKAEDSPSPMISGLAEGLKTVADTTSDTASVAWKGAKNLQKAAQNSESPAISGVALGLKDVSDATRGIASRAWEGTKNLFRSATDEHPRHMKRQKI